MSPAKQPTLPFVPLGGLLDRRLAGRRSCKGRGNQTAGLRSVLAPDQVRAYYRARRVGELTFNMADRFAAHFGMHPAEVWGEAWWALEEVLDA